MVILVNKQQQYAIFVINHQQEWLCYGMALLRDGFAVASTKPEDLHYTQKTGHACGPTYIFITDINHITSMTN